MKKIVFSVLFLSLNINANLRDSFDDLKSQSKTKLATARTEKEILKDIIDKTYKEGICINDWVKKLVELNASSTEVIKDVIAKLIPIEKGSWECVTAEMKNILFDKMRETRQVYRSFCSLKEKLELDDYEDEDYEDFQCEVKEIFEVSDPFYWILIKEDLGLVSSFLDLGFSVELKIKLEAQAKEGLNYTCPIVVALALRNMELIKLLLQNGADINTKFSYEGDSVYCLPLVMSIECGDLEMTKFLIECGADVNWVDEDGEGFLHLAAIANRPEIAKLLMDFGLYYLSPEDNFKITPLFLSFYYGSLDTIKVFWEYGAKQYADISCLKVAAKELHNDVILFFLDEFPDMTLNTREWSELLLVAITKSDDILMKKIGQAMRRPNAVKVNLDS